MLNNSTKITTFAEFSAFHYIFSAKQIALA